MKSIKFIYFDVGGVLLLDFSGTDKWQQMKTDLGITAETNDQFEAIWKKYRHRICIDYHVDSLVPKLAKIVDLNIPTDYSMLTDFVNRFELNPSIWPVVKQAQSKFKLGLLTNMYPKMLDLIQQRQLIPQVDWDSIIDSSIVGYQKPDSEIFHLAQEQVGVKPYQILFIDNSVQHVEAASLLGWQTLLYDSKRPKQSTKQLIRYLGLIYS